MEFQQIDYAVNITDGVDGFEHNGVWITDPTMDETGRFEVNPKEYYGVEIWNTQSSGT